MNTNRYTYALDSLVDKGQIIRVVSIECNDFSEPIELIIGPTEFCYNGLVNKIISYKYPNDKMQAIINNYLLEPEDETALSEFMVMQSWRSESKTIAKEILENFN